MLVRIKGPAMRKIKRKNHGLSRRRRATKTRDRETLTPRSLVAWL